jgi:hypothetical protein
MLKLYFLKDQLFSIIKKEKKKEQVFSHFHNIALKKINNNIRGEIKLHRLSNVTPVSGKEPGKIAKGGRNIT